MKKASDWFDGKVAEAHFAQVFCLVLGALMGAFLFACLWVAIEYAFG